MHQAKDDLEKAKYLFGRIFPLLCSHLYQYAPYSIAQQHFFKVGLCFHLSLDNILLDKSNLSRNHVCECFSNDFVFFRCKNYFALMSTTIIVVFIVIIIVFFLMFFFPFFVTFLIFTFLDADFVFFFILLPFYTAIFLFLFTTDFAWFVCLLFFSKE